MWGDDRKTYSYLRLSQEDGDTLNGSDSESCSISSQRTCIQQFLAACPDLPDTCAEIVDDGCSGTNLERPGMQRLLQLVDEGKVGTIVVRDLSRFSRNYLEAGHYLEFVFPALDVRFISINDAFDSAVLGEATGGLELAVKNLMNQLYSRDISRKIKSIVDMKKYRGEYAFGAAPYGYRKGSVKNSIVIDDEAANVVRRIFKWAAEGDSITRIAKRLNEENVPTPSVYLAAVRGNYKARTFWSYESVRNILNNRIYTGDTEPFKSHVVKVGSNRVKLIPEELREIIPDTHEAIISREQYYLAKTAVKTVASKHPQRKALNLLQPYLICGCCGNKLQKGRASNRNWRCASRRYTTELGCDQVLMEDARISNILLRAIQSQCRLLDVKLQKIQQEQKSAKSERELLLAEKKRCAAVLEKMQSEKMRYYEAFIEGALSKEEFFAKKQAVAENAEACKSQLCLIEQQLERAEKEEINRKRLAPEVKRFLDFRNVEKLTPTLLSALVKRITIYADRVIRIEWNFRDELAERLLAEETVQPREHSVGCYF